jgi:hypothetical protein
MEEPTMQNSDFEVCAEAFDQPVWATMGTIADVVAGKDSAIFSMIRSCCFESPL